MDGSRLDDPPDRAPSTKHASGPATTAPEATANIDDWLNKARFAHSLAPTEPWPAWSTGELLAVALILHYLHRRRLVR